MATFSDGEPAATSPVLSEFANNGLSSIGDMRLHLQNLLDFKERQLQQAGTLGQRILAQQVELEERVRQLQEVEVDKGDDEDLDSDIRDRYRDLAGIVKGWDSENGQMSNSFGSRQLTNGASQVVSSRTVDVPRESERSKAGPSSAAQSRRAKNAAHRADDVEFAFEIGSGLLTEVRRLQSLLGERDKAIEDQKEEKEDLDKTIESLRAGVRAQEQSSDKFKEENWNLEVTLQEMRVSLTDSQASTQRLESEHKRLTKLLAVSREATDQHKNESERLKGTLDEFKAKHETDVAQARKHAATLQRDKSDLQQLLDSAKADVARANRRLPRLGGSPLTPNQTNGDSYTTRDDDDDLFSPTTAASTNRKRYDTSALFPVDDEYSDSSPDPSPLRPILAPNHPSNEVEALQQRLAHAQRQINTLKGTLQREKELRMEYSRKLESTPRLDGDEENTPNDESSAPRRLTPFRVGRGSARGRGGRGSLLHRLGQAARQPKSDFGDDDDPDFGTPPAVPSIHAEFQDDDEDEEEEEFELRHSQVTSSPSLQVASNRTSVDGMDPAFANVLRRSSSQTSSPMSVSPLRHSVTARRGRGGTFPRRARGGAAYQDPRPPSLVGAPELLAAELGLGMESPVGMESLGEIGTLMEENATVETAEFGCQTDYEEPLFRAPTPPPIHVSPPTSDMAIQVEPEVIPTVVTVETSMQTEEEPAPSRSDMGMQHDMELPATVSIVETSTQTEEESVPSRSHMGTQHDMELPTMVSTSVNTEEVLATATAQAEVQTSEVALFNAETQTPQPRVIPLIERSESGSQTPRFVSSEMETQTPVFEQETPPLDLSYQRRATITQDTWGSHLSDIDGEDTITQHLPLYGNDDETEATETDADDYQDARAISSTASYSNSDDFHSIMTVTDNERSDSDDDDVESIKASRMASRQGASASSSDSSLPIHPIQTAFYRLQAPKPTYDSKGIETDEVEVVPEPAVVPVEVLPIAPPAPPKPELKEMSIQTDEWQPPPAPVIAPVPIALPVSAPTPALTSTPTVIPASPKPGFGLYRPGLNNQQFQFVSSPASGRPTTPLVPMAPLSPPHSRESSTMMRPRTSQSERRNERRQSIESALSSAYLDDLPRSRTTSTTPAPVDRTRPPMMSLPPPPKAPPPPGGSMLPPSFIPDKRSSHDIPPPRPLSPPPPELIQRATTPTFGSILNASGSRGMFATRQHGSSMPPSQQGMRQSPSTSSFRSAANAAAHAPRSPSAHAFGRRGEMSSTSLVSGSFVSHRSSLSSDHNVFVDSANTTPPRAPATPEPMADSSGGTTDPNVIHAITQTMIGEFLYKYTRRAIGKGHGERRHKRFFWVHPYTKTLYWSAADPGSSNVSESSAKSTYIENVRSVLDPNPMPPGLYQYSIVISTPSREMKITAPTKERHDIWLNALKYLLSRPGALPTRAGEGSSALSPMSALSELPDETELMSSPQSHRSGHSALSADSWNHTPKGQGQPQRSQSQLSLRGSMGKRSGTPAAEYLRWAEREGAYSPSPSKSYERVRPEDEELSFELHDGNMSDDGYEGMENVRACCDGRHTVGGQHVHDHDPHHTHQQQQPSLARQPHLDVNARELSRPISPAWSFRSRADSKDSQSLFSRFGSRRSAKAPVVNGDG